MSEGLCYSLRSADEVVAARPLAVDELTLEAAAGIVDSVRERGAAAVREHAMRLGDLAAGEEPLVLDRAELEQAAREVSPEVLALLERVAGRIRSFAEVQRGALVDVEHPIPGGRQDTGCVPYVPRAAMHRAGATRCPPRS